MVFDKAVDGSYFFEWIWEDGHQHDDDDWDEDVDDDDDDDDDDPKRDMVGVQLNIPHFIPIIHR